MAEMLVQLPDGEIIPDPDEAFFDLLASSDPEGESELRKETAADVPLPADAGTL